MISHPSIGDQQRVYSAFSKTFNGTLHLTKKKVQAELLSEQEGKLPQTLEGLKYDKIVEIILFLSCKGAFTSVRKARKLFPNLFKATPSNVQTPTTAKITRQVQNNTVAATKSLSVEKIAPSKVSTANTSVERSQQPIGNTSSTDKPNKLGSGSGECKSPSSIDTEQTTPKKCTQSDDSVGIWVTSDIVMGSQPPVATSLNPLHVPSLPPARFPYPIQYSILRTTQELLEHACFDFTSRHCPAILHVNGWDCPESMELNIWAARIQALLEDPVGSSMPSSFRSAPFLNVAPLVIRLRHVAVHRRKLDAEMISGLVGNGIALLDLLGAEDHAEARGKLEGFQQALQALIADQKSAKAVLEKRLTGELEEIERVRRLREEEVRRQYVADDEQNMRDTTKALEQRLLALSSRKNSEEEEILLEQEAASPSGSETATACESEISADSSPPTPAVDHLQLFDDDDNQVLQTCIALQRAKLEVVIKDGPSSEPKSIASSSVDTISATDIESAEVRTQFADATHPVKPFQNKSFFGTLSELFALHGVRKVDSLEVDID